MANTRCFQHSCYYAFSIGSKESTWAYSWTWRHNVALSQTVSSVLPAALWHRSVKKKKKKKQKQRRRRSKERSVKIAGHNANDHNQKSIAMCFFHPLNTKITSPPRRNAFFLLLSHTPASRHECPY